MLQLYKTHKLLFFFLAGWNFAPIVKLFEKYVFSDWEFLKFLFVICLVDTLLGFFKAFKQKNISSRGFSMVFTKLIIYSAALIASHVLVSFTIHNTAYAVFSWFDTVIFSAIIVREGVSIFENIAVIEPNAFPKKILKYLRDFDATGNLKKETE